MTDWSTVNIPKKFKEEIAEHVKDSSYSSEKDFIMYAARKVMEEETTEDIVRKILEKEDLI